MTVTTDERVRRDQKESKMPIQFTDQFDNTNDGDDNVATDSMPK